ncbi:hypothetical protein DYB32_003660 [Aphanomyces invadans]|uniref:Uncharacterized protein n=1 Tax=Aphanomyces invadans TaxID=157072 RepID=A0A3R6ZS53_9STRA|nr:hypothetical protein DYB32_003660 [Aphanomyces invadans]
MVFERRNVPGTRNFRRMHQYRMSLADAIAEYSAAIAAANAHKKVVSLELVEVASRRKRLDEGFKVGTTDARSHRGMCRRFPPSAGGKALSKKELQDVQQMMSAYSDLTTHLNGRPPGFVASTIPVAVHVLGPHLDLLHAQLSATIQNAKANIQEAAVDVQRVFRGHCGRVKARQRKIESNLSEPVRQLVSELQTTGDLWAFVQAVDNEYRHFDRERRDEEENARGLEAQGKTTRNVKLVLRELKRRTPLMLNALKSERVVRQSRQKSPPKHVPPPSVVLDSAALSHPPSSDGLAVVDDKMVATFLAQMLPDGVNEPMGKVIFAAAMLAFVPPLVDVDGASSVVLADPWTSSPNSHFAAYVKAPSALLQHHIDSRHVRRQQSAVPPSRVKSAARAIASPMTMRSSTADTILYDLTSRGVTPASSPDDDPPSHGMSEIQCQFLDMKARIEATALTPVEMDSSLFDLFFQALFVVLPLDEATTQTPTSEAMNPCHLDSFVYQLLDPALTMHASHRLLKRRSQRTATMARAYSNAFKAANCHCVHRSLDAFHVPDVLAEQVRACIGKVLFPVSRYTIQHYRLPGHTRRTDHS